MKQVVLDRLVDIPVVISPSNRDKIPFRPGSRFEFPVVLTHTGQNPIDWSQESPLNLSYRWLTLDGEVVERDGLRTALPSGALVPGARLELDLAGIAPENEGSYLLLVSLVLEGAHWACNVGVDGWTQLEVLIALAPAWPVELRDSRGGRALRGAMAAAELARLIAQKTDSRSLSPKPVAFMVSSDLNHFAVASIEPKPVRRGPRNWFRVALGVRALEDQLSDVIERVVRQEEHALALHEQIVMLSKELQGALTSQAQSIRSNPGAFSRQGAAKKNTR